MKLIMCGIIILGSGLAQAYDVYVSGNRLNNAIRAVYLAQSPRAGFAGDCLSCHSNVPNIAPNTFGFHFRTASTLVANGTLTQQQLQTVVQNLNLRQLDSDGDTENNELEFRNGTDPGDRNSNSQNPTTTTSTTTITTTTRRPNPNPNPGNDVSKQTVNPDGNYLSSGGCGNLRQASVSDPMRWDVAAPVGVFVLIPFAVAFGLRRRK